MSAYEWVFRHVLQRVDAERAHRISFTALRAITGLPGGTALVQRLCRGPDRPVAALGVTFPNPLGLAAGFDKDAKGIDALGALGFGFVEVGTVTARPQPGNPRPRLFRLPDDRAIVNRMGFNNDGAEAVAGRLGRRSQRRADHRGRWWGVRGSQGPSPRVGVNLGRSKATPDDAAIDDYVSSARLVAPYADYLVVNVSSPNTPGLRELQAVESLRPLLTAVRDAARGAAGRPVPLLVKIAPDLSDDEIVAIAVLATELRLDGIVATNTTVSRDGLRSSQQDVAAAGAGGLSGAPLRDRSVAVLALLRRHLDDGTVIISVGGIESAADAQERLDAGATLVQAYTALVYGGPFWPRRVLRELNRRTSSSAQAGRRGR
ncbi:MAG TPA: quinone-dependent dihydroorotate dehydrogenase [Jiangellaceae bacterium]